MEMIQLTARVPVEQILKRTLVASRMLLDFTHLQPKILLQSGGSVKSG